MRAIFPKARVEPDPGTIPRFHGSSLHSGETLPGIFRSNFVQNDPESMPQSDRDIVNGIVAGNQQSAAELVRRYADRGFALAMQVLRDREDAEEAVQDAFMRVFRSLDRFEWKSAFSTWFYRIVYNICMSSAQSRRRGHMLLREEEWTLEPVALPDSMPDKLAEDAEFDRIVRQEIASMPEEYALVLTLFLLNEQTYEEICAITDLPLGTVKNRLFRARQRLRDAVLRHYRDHVSLTAEPG